MMISVVTGDPDGGEVGDPVDGPVGGEVGDPVDGPVGGEVGDPVDGPVGGEVGDPVDGPVGGSVGTKGRWAHCHSRNWLLAGERLVNESSSVMERAWCTQFT